MDSLTPEARAEILRWWQDQVIPAGEWIIERNQQDKAKMLKEKPSLVFSTLSDEEIAKFKKAAKTVYPKYVEIGGDGAQDILDTFLKDIEDAKKALNIK